MDKTQIAQLKKRLLDEKALIESELLEIAKKSPLVKGDWISVSEDQSDPSDTMDERAHVVTDLEERRAIEQSLELRLKEIDETLLRVDFRTYGKCTSCSLDIDPKRLEVTPVASTCFSCSKRPTFS